MIPHDWVKEVIHHSQKRKLIKLSIAISTGVWSIYQTWLDYIFFTAQSFIYMLMLLFCCIRKNECVVRYFGEVTSLTLITVQFCLLAQITREVAYCNFITFIIYLASGVLQTYPSLLVDGTTMIQLLELIACAYFTGAFSAFILAMVYFYLRFQISLLLADYELVVALSLYVMGMATKNC